MLISLSWAKSTVAVSITDIDRSLSVGVIRIKNCMWSRRRLPM